MNTELNIVRLESGEDFVRFEFANECPWGTMHNSRGEALDLHIEDARYRSELLQSIGWKIVSIKSN